MFENFSPQLHKFIAKIHKQTKGIAKEQTNKKIFKGKKKKRQTNTNINHRKLGGVTVNQYFRYQDS